jgi:hypothetical protein
MVHKSNSFRSLLNDELVKTVVLWTYKGGLPSHQQDLFQQKKKGVQLNQQMSDKKQ